jgi:hypothetical protein
MPKRIRDKNKSIFVKFYDETRDHEVGALLMKLGVSGVRVSNLVNRWAVEVPFWKEEFFTEKLQNSELVERINQGFDKKRKNIVEEEGEYENE